MITPDAEAFPEVFLVGHRYSHHAGHSGYDGFARYVGRRLRPPVGFRFLRFPRFPLLGWRIDQALGAILRRRCYSVGLLLTEVAAAKHMLFHPGALYHVLYGDTDLWLLGTVRRGLRVRVVATFHEPIEALEWLRIDASLIRRLDAIIIVSESQRPYFVDKIDPNRIFLVPHGVDTEFFRPDSASTQDGFLTVGGHLRDFETLSVAIEIVRGARPDVRFIAVGTKHGHEGRPFDHPQVEFLEGVDDADLLRLYRCARAAVFSFKQSTANNSILEGMAAGLPIVCTDVGGVREYVGDAGILCRPRDPNALGQAMLDILEQPIAARAMGRRARQRALAFEFSSVAERHRAVYRAVARGLRMDLSTTIP